jgi:hypothetical protein
MVGPFSVVAENLINHYQFHCLPFQGIKTNEFWLVCKVLAMTLFKLSQGENIPKALHALLLKTFLRRSVVNLIVTSCVTFNQ